jgi:hypothetical protein
MSSVQVTFNFPGYSLDLNCKGYALCSQLNVLEKHPYYPHIFRLNSRHRS